MKNQRAVGTPTNQNTEKSLPIFYNHTVSKYQNNTITNLPYQSYIDLYDTHSLNELYYIAQRNQHGYVEYENNSLCKENFKKAYAIVLDFDDKYKHAQLQQFLWSDIAYNLNFIAYTSKSNNDKEGNYWHLVLPLATPIENVQLYEDFNKSIKEYFIKNKIIPDIHFNALSNLNPSRKSGKTHPKLFQKMEVLTNSFIDEILTPKIIPLKKAVINKESDFKKFQNSYERLSLPNRFSVMKQFIYALKNQQIGFDGWCRVGKVLYNTLSPKQASHLWMVLSVGYKGKSYIQAEKDWKRYIENDDFNDLHFSAIIPLIKEHTNYSIKKILKQTFEHENKQKKNADMMLFDAIEVLKKTNEWIDVELFRVSETELFRKIGMQYIDKYGEINIKTVTITELKRYFTTQNELLEEVWTTVINHYTRDYASHNIDHLYEDFKRAIIATIHTKGFLSLSEFKKIRAEKIKPHTTSRNYKYGKYKQSSLTKLLTQDGILLDGTSYQYKICRKHHFHLSQSPIPKEYLAEAKRKQQEISRMLFVWKELAEAKKKEKNLSKYEKSKRFWEDQKDIEWRKNFEVP